MILKWALRILIVLLALYASWYLFEFVNPWIGILVAIIVIAYFLDKLVKKLKK